MDELTLAQRVAVWALPLVFAVTVHEAAHGWVADRLGDPTARKLGRITFNPLPHIDLVGTILVPMLMLAFTGFLLGWAKPVPVSVGRLRHPKRDMAIVAAAGPAVNLLMAIVWSIALLIAHNLVHSLPAIAVPLLLIALVLAVRGFWLVLPFAGLELAALFASQAERRRDRAASAGAGRREVSPETTRRTPRRSSSSRSASRLSCRKCHRALTSAAGRLKFSWLKV
mgnify:CR=1 FL=1